MKYAINLLHRQAVKAKAEGLFFQVSFRYPSIFSLRMTIQNAKVSTLCFFKSILDDRKLLPVDQPYKDLITFVNYILRQFFKAIEKEPFLSIEVSGMAALKVDRELRKYRRSFRRLEGIGSITQAGNLRRSLTGEWARITIRFHQNFKSREDTLYQSKSAS
jgi:hypothetical protein